MYPHLLQIHSVLRWVLLVFLILTLVKAFMGWFGNKDFAANDKRIALVALILSHLQLVLGIILFFVSPIVQQGLSDMGATMKDKNLRFWTVEHTSTMIFGIILITLGYSRAKRLANGVAKHKNLAIFYGIGLILILSRIPWDRL